MKPYLQLAIIPLLLVVWGLFVAPQLTNYSYNSLANYQTPYTEKTTPGNTGEPLTSQVVLIVVDGLRLDVSQTMTNVNALRVKGANRVLRVGMPSFSATSWATIGTGAWVEQHGQVLNRNLRPMPLASIFTTVQHKGLKSAASGAAGWAVLTQDWTEFKEVVAGHGFHVAYPPFVELESNLKRFLSSGHQLILIHNDWSRNVENLMPAADDYIGKLTSHIDLNSTTLLLVSSHGQSERGENGGNEDAILNVPFIAAGKGVKAGAYVTATLADIAPTLAVLLGASFPTDNQGDALFDMLDMPDDAKAKRAVEWAQQVIARYDTIAKFYGVSVTHKRLDDAHTALSAGQSVEALRLAQGEVNATRAAVAVAREGRIQQERYPRTPTLLLFWSPLVVYVWFMRRLGWELRRPLSGALVYFVVFYALFFGTGLTFSWSVFNSDLRLNSSFIPAVSALLVMALVMGLLTRDDDHYYTALDVFNAAFWIFAALWLQVCIFYWSYGFAWTWFIPDHTLLLKYFVDVWQTNALSVSVALPLVAIGTKWLLARVGRRRGDSAD
jgi:hypothetical protein